MCPPRQISIIDFVCVLFPWCRHVISTHSVPPPRISGLRVRVHFTHFFEIRLQERYSNSYEINVFMREQFYSFVQIYTDGSKDPIEQKVGIGVYIPRFKTEISLRLSDKLSVYSTELTAIIVGLQWVEQIKPNRIVIC